MLYEILVHKYWKIDYLMQIYLVVLRIVLKAEVITTKLNGQSNTECMRVTTHD